jgi:hypothetical protein
MNHQATANQYFNKFGLPNPAEQQQGKKSKHSKSGETKTKKGKIPQWKDITVTHFKSLQGLQEYDQLRLLRSVASGDSSLPQMQREAKVLHIVYEIKSHMVKEISKMLPDIKSWEELEAAFPQFTRETDINNWMREVNGK